MCPLFNTLDAVHLLQCVYVYTPAASFMKAA